MKFRFLCFCILMCIAAYGRAQDKGFGIGIIVGEPTGLSGKYWLSEKNAIDGGLAWSFIKGGSLHLHADYLWHLFNKIQTSQRVPVYFGIGGRMKFRSGENAHVGVRIVGGVDLLLDDAPIDVFVELAPIMDLIPATELALNGGIGVRFFF